MKITKITYEETVQMKPYEPVRLGFEATINDGDDIAIAMNALKKKAAELFQEIRIEQEAKKNPKVNTEKTVTPKPAVSYTTVTTPKKSDEGLEQPNF